MIDWPETRLRLQLWLHRAWPIRIITWLRFLGVPKGMGFGRFGDNEIEPLTPEQQAAIANAEPRKRDTVSKNGN